MKIVKILTVVVSFSLLSCVSWVFAKSQYSEMPEGHYKLDLTHASVVWKVSHFGLSDYVARFASFDGAIDFDPGNLANSEVQVSIDPRSIQTAYPNADEEDFNHVLATDDGWFNAGAFPSIDFVSTNIAITGENTAIMTGDLTFLGNTLPVSLDVTLNGAMQLQPFTRKPTMGFSASTVIERSRWGMTKYIPFIGDSVTVMIEAEFVKTE
ncbi:YceI family protein [Alteromonas gilva]|uniref:YceI family protein n=1 Tax=Alteromonas gilva TaxID=2987522 RepID=A0ABT5L257_9ALTE|nr:YceI family protein [Alteromonas gilva]MDC8831134.1 YceI family protein [Alteromonas gilva]